ncbi:hypothetical protein BD779DRAFT_1434293 [Infundibulicybe gibba]|nr:hypothetical protein BD779DRAFT_1434293 [Infundibulicybe gibba]
MFAFTILCFSFFVTLVRTLPLDQRDVFNPPITSPNGQTVWVVGQTATVTWDITNIPPDSQLSNPNGMVVLGFDANNSLNLMLANPLAKGFKVRDGKVDITVPSVPPRDDYIVVVFGDSGNASPKFVIQAPGASSGAPGPSTSESSTPEPNTSAPGTPASSTSQPGAKQEPTPTSTLITTPIPITGSVITGAPTDVPASTAPPSALSQSSPASQSSSARSSSPLSASAAGASGSPPTSGALPRLSGTLQAISIGLASLSILYLI